MPAASLGTRTLSAEGQLALTRWLLQCSVTHLEGAFHTGREKLGWRCGLGSLCICSHPTNTSGLGGKPWTGARFAGSVFISDNQV